MCVCSITTCCCHRTWWRCWGCCAAGCPLWGWIESPSAPARRSACARGRTSAGCARWDATSQRKNTQNEHTQSTHSLFRAHVPPVGLRQVKTLHAGGVPLNPLEHWGVVVQIPGVKGQTWHTHKHTTAQLESLNHFFLRPSKTLVKQASNGLEYL